MRACSVIIALVSLLAVAHGYRAVEHLVFESPADDATPAANAAGVGPVSVQMIFGNGDSRTYPNDDDQDEIGYDKDCEDEPDETYCPPLARLGVSTIAKVNKNGFGVQKNDFGEDIPVDPAMQGHAVSGGATIPVVGSGQSAWGLVAIDGECSKVSSIYRVKYDLKLNVSDDLTSSATYVSTMKEYGVLSPSSPRMTPWCTTVMAEQIALDSKDFEESTDNVNERTSSPYPALKAYHHMPPAGGKLDDLTPWMNGWPVEARIENNNGDTSVMKRFAMGRGNWDGVSCMPDGVTCLFWGENMLFAFVAENKGGLDYGRLLYSKLSAKTEDDPAKISWMEFDADPIKYVECEEDEEDCDPVPTDKPAGQGASLAHEDEIEAAVTKNKEEPEKDTKYSDMFKADGTLKSGVNKKLASRLETVRYAKSLGASEDFGGLADVAFSREYADGDDRGAIFLAFTTTAGNTKLPGASADGGVFRASLTSFKDVVYDDDDEVFDTEKLTSWLPGGIVEVDSDKAASKTQNPTSVAWSHFHNMLLVGTAQGTIVGIETDDTWCEAKTCTKYQGLYRSTDGAQIKGLIWNQNMIGNGDAYLTFGLHYGTATKVAEWSIIGPMRMRGYLGGNADVLQNLGCPVFNPDHFLFKEWTTQEWPLPEEDEDED